MPPARARASVPLADRQVRSVSNRPLETEHDADPDQVFVDNAERAIALYREFLERAGNEERFAPAVLRSREEIEALQASVVFVKNGMGERARK